MKRKIYAISMLLSFLVVFGHMMVPHHHHESSILDFSNFQSPQETHSHSHNGKHHHSHDEEENDNQAEHNSDHGFPQHFHISATDNFDLLRVNQTGKIDYKKDIQYFIDLEWLTKRFSESPNIISISNSDLLVHFQHKPGANSLRGPPSIA